MIQDLVSILFLVFMEGVLSVDNALVLAIMVCHLPEKDQRKALTWGMAGAFGFRFLSLFILNFLMASTWIKFAGGAYLLYLAWKHFFGSEHEAAGRSCGGGLLRTIIAVELMDIAFSADSILAAVAVSPKLWVVVTGGILGIIMMRFAATVFVKLIKRFPKLVTTAYLLVATIGAKLAVDGFGLDAVDFHSATNPAFWVFWLAMTGCILSGFRRTA